MAETKVKRELAPRDVNYQLEIVDDLDLDANAGFTRVSPFDENLDRIRTDPSLHGQWVRLGSYGSGTAAPAAANVLRQKHGRSAAVKGFVFTSKKYDHKNDDGSLTVRTGLFTKYDPSKIVDGALDEHVKAEQTRLAKLDAKREAAKNGQATDQVASAGTEPEAKAKSPRP